MFKRSALAVVSMKVENNFAASSCFLPFTDWNVGEFFKLKQKKESDKFREICQLLDEFKLPYIFGVGIDSMDHVCCKTGCKNVEEFLVISVRLIAIFFRVSGVGEDMSFEEFAEKYKAFLMSSYDNIENKEYIHHEFR